MKMVSPDSQTNIDAAQAHGREPRPRYAALRSYMPRFSLATLLVFAGMASVLLGIVGKQIHHVRMRFARETEAAEVIQLAGGRIYFSRVSHSSLATWLTSGRFDRCVVNVVFDVGAIDYSNDLGDLGQDLQFDRISHTPIPNSREVFRAIAKLSNLSYLDLRGRKLILEDFALLKGSRSIHHLRLTDTGTADDAMLVVASMSNLWGLSVGLNPVTDEGVRALCDLPLKSLSVSHTKITDEGVQALRNLPLESLIIGNTAITDESLAVLREIETLSSLDMLNANVSDAGLRKLAGHPNLKHLYVPFTSISDESITTFRKLRKLKSIGAWHTKITPEGARRLQKSFQIRVSR